MSAQRNVHPAACVRAIGHQCGGALVMVCAVRTGTRAFMELHHASSHGHENLS